MTIYTHMYNTKVMGSVMGNTDVHYIVKCIANITLLLLLFFSLSGLMPETVQVQDNRLAVQKVDDSVNTTFICEVRNSLGSGKDQVTIIVRGKFVCPRRCFRSPVVIQHTDSHTF